MSSELKSGSLGRRLLDRVRGLSRVHLSSAQVIAELSLLIGQALRTKHEPDFLLLENRTVPQHEFVVVRGKETITDEIRLALSAGIWPGPPGTISPLDLLSGAQSARFAAVTLWGGEDSGPWDDFWRHRGVRHGLYGVYFSRARRIGVILTCRGNDAPPFDSADVAFAESCAPYVEAAMDLPQMRNATLLAPADQIQVRFGADGRLAAMQFGGREFLRDMGGGGPGATALALERVEAENRARAGLAALGPDVKAALSLAGEPDERAFRTSMVDLTLRSRDDPDRAGASTVLADNGFGRFHFDLSTLVGIDGALERVGILTRYVPPLLLRVRGALRYEATGRELELLSALSVTGALKAAAEELRISKATARTLGERLARRIGERNLAIAADRLLEIGRADPPRVSSELGH